MRSRPIAALACLIALLAGCAEPGDGPAADLTDVPWELVSGTVDGAPMPSVAGFPITLTIGEDAATGTAACNGYSATVTTSGTEITFSGLGATEMACSPNEVMESEQRYLEALPRVESWSSTEGNLTLTGDGVEMLFEALPPVPTAELTGTVWVLESLVDGDSVSSVGGERATLELFSDKSMLGSTGCRDLHGRYQVAGAEVRMPEMAAEGECPPDLQAQDGQVITVLGDGFRASVEGQVLNLTSSGGLGLVYRAEPK
jgi:heat shock protein HslJ